MNALIKLLALVVAVGMILAYEWYPDWVGWYPIGWIGLMVMGLAYIIVRDQAAQDWQKSYNAMSDREKIAYHERRAQTCGDTFGANYHNNMAQTIIQRRILDRAE